MILHGDCLEKMRELEANSVDTIITDPPYGLSFMGKKWDYDVPSIEIWKEALRVLKPGGTALIFAGSRTQHRMAVNVEDAGFILKDCIMYLYGSGFPKATDCYKQLVKQCKCGTMVEYEKKTTKENTKYELRPLREADLQATEYITDKQREILLTKLQEQGISEQGETPEPIFISKRQGQSCVEGWCNILQKEGELYRCALCSLSRRVSEDGEKRWIHNGTQVSNGSTLGETANEEGSGTSQRPQSEQQQDREPCSFCQQFSPQEVRAWNGWKSHGLKPAYEPILVAMKPNDGTYANNALKHGVSGLNIDGGRIGVTTRTNSKGKEAAKGSGIYGEFGDMKTEVKDYGRFPANIILDEEAGAMLDEQSGELKAGVARKQKGGKNIFSETIKPPAPDIGYGGKGGASRFFYCAKASKAERNAGCEGLEGKVVAWSNQAKAELKRGNEDWTGDGTTAKHNKVQKLKNSHPTVKPLKLMEYLCTLTKTPTGGNVLDPFMGSGTTGIACVNTGREFIGIEMDEEYIEIAKARIEHASNVRL